MLTVAYTTTHEIELTFIYCYLQKFKRPQIFKIDITHTFEHQNMI